MVFADMLVDRGRIAMGRGGGFVQGIVMDVLELEKGTRKKVEVEGCRMKVEGRTDSRASEAELRR